jgi:hypothetical protein
MVLWPRRQPSSGDLMLVLLLKNST